MRINQVRKIMEELGLSKFNEWTRFPTQLSEIQLANDAREYADKTVFYKIDTKNETIEVSRNHKMNEEIDDSKEYTVDDIYYIQYIDAFVCSSAPGPYGSYYTKMF